VHRFCGGRYLIGCRRRENLTGTSGVEHAVANKPRMQRLVPTATPGDQRDLAALDLFAAHEAEFAIERDDVAMALREAGKTLTQHRLRAVHELLHVPPSRRRAEGASVVDARARPDPRNTAYFPSTSSSTRPTISFISSSSCLFFSRFRRSGTRSTISRRRVS